MPRFLGPSNLQYAATDGSTVPFDLSKSNSQVVTFLAATARTLTLSNAVVGQSFTIKLVYGGANAVTWFTGWTIRWPGAAAPTPTAVSGKADYFTFVVTSATTLDGFLAGANL